MHRQRWPSEREGGSSSSTQAIDGLEKTRLLNLTMCTSGGEHDAPVLLWLPPGAPLPPPPACLLLSLDALQKGRVALQHLETAGSSVSPKLSLAVGQHWRSSSGPCTGGCGAGPGAGRGGRPWSGGRAGTAAPRLQSSVALRLPPPAGGGRNWPTVKFTYFDL